MSRLSRFRDDEGWTWEAVERERVRPQDRGSDEGQADRALYFLSRFETRRCDEFPNDWQRRPVTELLDLCREAVPL